MLFVKWVSLYILLSVLWVPCAPDKVQLVNSLAFSPCLAEAVL